MRWDCHEFAKNLKQYIVGIYMKEKVNSQKLLNFEEKSKVPNQMSISKTQTHQTTR